MPDTLERLKTALSDRYAFERELGAGGMATVWLAQDRKHHRQVAVKVLRPELAATLGPDRFLREVDIAANLQHPHILPLHDSGEADGFLYYVMPFVEGMTLRTRLRKERELPVGEAVRILRDVADAMAEAHAKGVIHRDLKPENIMLTGRHAVVADFGVAKAVSEATGQQRLTTAGIAMGTPTYMAPEQATADPLADHRADIYALGVVAYEMLTGEPPFVRTTAPAMLAAHLTETPVAVTERRGAVPGPLAAMVMKCLEKKPADRPQRAEELLEVLEGLATPSGGTTPAGMQPVAGAALPAGPNRGRKAMLGAAAALVVAAGAIAAWRLLSPAEPEWELANLRQVSRERELELYPAISPSGRDVAYAGGYATDMHVFVRDVTGGRALALTAERPGVHESPSWSSDGSRVSFCEIGMGGGGAFVVPRMGGPLTRLGRPTEGVWRDSRRRCVSGLRGDSVLAQRGDSLFVADAGGAWETFVASAPMLHSAAWSPDGSRVAFVSGNSQYVGLGIWGNAAPSAIWTAPANGGPAVRVTEVESGAIHESPVWLPDGRHLLLVSNRDGPRDLYVLGIGADGQPRSPLRRVSTGLEPHTVSISADGRAVAYSRFIQRRNLYRIAVPRSGSVSIREAVPRTTANQVIEQHDLSRDGHWLAFDSDIAGNSDIYVMPAAGGEPRRLTSDPGQDYAPSFSPDGRQVAFHSTRFGTRDLFVVSADGTEETRLTSGPGDEQQPAFSPDGLRIAYTVSGEGRGEVFVLRRDSVGGAWGTPEQLTHEGWGTKPRWSPDGRQLVYQSAGGISVLPLGGAEREVLNWEREALSSRITPTWSPDGRAIWFGASRPDGQAGIFEVPLAGGRPRMIVRFDDPARAVVPYKITEAPGAMYLTIDDSESDIYVAELRRR